MAEAPVQQQDDQADKADNAARLTARAVELAGQEWLELARKPVSKVKPAGDNVRLEPVFEQIEAEIAKLESLTNESPVEWGLILEWCQEILEHQSKDLLVACYMSRALCESGLLQGLLKGTLLNLALAETYWDNCYPPKKRARGRAAAYDWWIEQCVPLVGKANLNVGHLDNLALVIGLLETLDSFLAERLGEEAPGINELVQMLRRQQTSLEAEKRARAQKREQAAPAAPAARPAERTTTDSGQPAQATAGAINNDRDLQNCYRSVQAALRGACEYLRGESLAGPEAFRINRFLTWLGVVQLPPDTNGVTQLRPPPKEKLQHYDALEKAGNFKALVPEMEVSLSKAPYWLDGQRKVHHALTELGYSEAADAVAEGVRAFVTRFPKVTELKFSDQTEFADAQTRQWLQLEVLQGQQGGGNYTLPVSGTADHEWEDAYSQALQLFREKKRHEAFALFRDGCRQAFSQRSLAFWRYYQARFCFETQQTDLAIALLESVNKTLQDKGFEDWEPEISAKVLELLIRAYQQQSESEIPRTRVAALHERLCQFDLATAYELSVN
ncbi:MAG: type VI secretion system protein TssA [Ketobacteraceae bacterium]|nr:type VI secretion system protein TssA [Ketobacteraceae bacterium]